MNMVLSILMLAAFALFAGAIYLWRGKGETKRAGLMALLGAIMIANVAIWTVPDGEGTAPVDRVYQGLDHSD